MYGPCIFALLLPPLSKKKLRWAACAGGGNYALPTARAAKIRARRQTLKNKYGLRNYLVPSRRTGSLGTRPLLWCRDQVASYAVSALGPEPGSNWVRSRPHLLRVLINPDSIRIQRTHMRMWVEVSSTRIQRWAWYLSHDNRRRHAQT